MREIENDAYGKRQIQGETFSIRFFMGNCKRKPQFEVTRLQFHVAEISNFSKAFSSVYVYLAKI